MLLQSVGLAMVANAIKLQAKGRNKRYVFADEANKRAIQGDNAIQGHQAY